MPRTAYWRKPGGYTVVTNRFDAPILNAGRVVEPFGTHERHSFTCCHCNKVTFVESGRHDDIGRCTCCDDLICNQCIGKPCLPLQKRLGLYENGMIRHLGVLNDVETEILKTREAVKNMQLAMTVLQETLGTRG